MAERRPKARADKEGSVYPEHAKGCPEYANRTNPKCKCKWRAAYVVGHKPGKKPGTLIPVRKRATRATRSGAATALREMAEAHRAKTLPVGTSPTVEQWLNHCHARLLPATVNRKGLRDTSLAKYRSNMDNYLIPLLGAQRLDRLTADDIEDAWQTLAEIGNPLKGADAKPLAADTIHLAHVILSRCLRLAVRKRRLTSNPAGPDAMAAPPKGKEEAEPLATEDWKKVLGVAPKYPNPARWTVALAIGLRQGEALGLRWEDVDLEDGSLRVRQILFRLTGRGLLFGPPKTERSKRAIALPPELVKELRAHRKAQAEARLLAGDHWQDSGLVFTHEDGRPIDPSTDRQRWYRLLAAADVAPIKLHSARHTAATTLLLRGVDARIVMDIMGWSQISTAANYQHAVSEAKRSAAAAISAAVWG